MLIAFTHNLQLTDSEDEAEFDRPETVNALVQAFNNLGHSVELVEVSGPASRVVAVLEALNPDIVFNTAEGRIGRYREAFYPGLFEQIGLPYTGSDAYVCTLTMDKRLTKDVIGNVGVPTPRFVYIDNLVEWVDPSLKYPVIVKPNFEGSSIGITQDSIVDDPVSLQKLVAGNLSRFPAGLLVEEYIEGRDVVVPFLEKASHKTLGVLPAGEYVFDESVARDLKYRIYDYNLKQRMSHAVHVNVPANLSTDQQAWIQRYSQIIFKTLDIRDLGRIDYRITPDGKIYFLEINALPSLEPGATIYESASKVGIHGIEGVLNCVLMSAAERYNLQISKRVKRRKGSLKVGLTYNIKRSASQHIPHGDQGDSDAEAEYDTPQTIEAMAAAISSFGHEVVKLEATPELPGFLGSLDLDLVFNVAEGIQGRNREAQVPAILELLGITYVGSDPATLSISLDKVLAKRMVREAVIATPNFAVLRTGKERLPKNLSFPVILKPAFEGSSKGVMPVNVVHDETSLRSIGVELLARYQQPILVEEFLTGREFTVALLGENRPKVLPIMEIIFRNKAEKFPVYSYEHKLAANQSVSYEVPAKIDSGLQRALERTARSVFMALGCRDVARVDLRLDQRGTVNFIECNPLPGLTPGWSDLCLIAEAAGMTYHSLIGEIMSPAIRRLKMAEKSSQIVKMAG